MKKKLTFTLGDREFGIDGLTLRQGLAIDTALAKIGTGTGNVESIEAAAEVVAAALARTEPDLAEKEKLMALVMTSGELVQASADIIRYWRTGLLPARTAAEAGAE